MSEITTHVLDAVRGKPAENLSIALDLREDAAWLPIGVGATDKDGRCRGLCLNAHVGTYRLTFQTRPYFEAQARRSIYPEVVVVFTIDSDRDYHIPLLLSDNSYTTYRGS